MKWLYRISLDELEISHRALEEERPAFFVLTRLAAVFHRAASPA
jgi:hypothetical protein